MSSGYSPWWKRKILYHIPRLFKKCPEGNYHWFWDKFCLCCDDNSLYSFRLNKFRTLEASNWKIK